MKLENNTVLITGGGSGIGLEIAKQLHPHNKVIIVGRNLQKLAAVEAMLPGVTTLQADVTKEQDVKELVKTVVERFETLNVLINNAGLAYITPVLEETTFYQTTSQEFETNFFAPLKLIQQFLPLLRTKEEAAIVNVTSIAALCPSAPGAGYCASKGALHSYTQSLRQQLKDSSVKLFELMPPLVATEFSSEIGGLEHGMPASEVATELIAAWKTDLFEIHVGDTKAFYDTYFSKSQEAFEMLNAPMNS
ncbi:SDR family oxidoreductase [Neptunitalea lumnitzerae]|uniref:Oxidoreductase DltE n=1 Tax=Neptunitalea lumnitzerae TaxID=2965509 RepID=A0ABQ5MJ50_9FLAO|nr:SDR family NAD(P)-dependent oxidoreductase [Neptunitalea sp. Y10]GLB49423.1 putative oxidoreductase DltE [Neptunitalea sp. Y10]